MLLTVPETSYCFDVYVVLISAAFNISCVDIIFVKYVHTGKELLISLNDLACVSPSVS